MSTILYLFTIGISLSMDAFSVSLSIGTFNNKKKYMLYMCLLVYIFHFILPIIGYSIGITITRYLKINTNIMLGLILIFIAVEMIIDVINKNDSNYKINLINVITISFIVSIDSFSTGIGLKAITDNYLLASFIISMNAISFTYFGFLIGKYYTDKMGIYAKITGIIILIVLGLLNIFK